MLDKIEKWAIQRLLKKHIQKIKAPKIWILEIWEKQKDAIYKEIVNSIDAIISKIITESLENKNIDVGKEVR